MIAMMTCGMAVAAAMAMIAEQPIVSSCGM
jgi:hypothetical protein